MQHYNQYNTEGYSQSQLDTLNFRFMNALVGTGYTEEDNDTEIKSISERILTDFDTEIS